MWLLRVFILPFFLSLFLLLVSFLSQLNRRWADGPSASVAFHTRHNEAPDYYIFARTVSLVRPLSART